MKRYEVRITDLAEEDTRRNYCWWAEHRSAEQAAAWVLGIQRAMLSLGAMPERFGFADERELMQRGVRQMGFGLGVRPTHRILYEVRGDEVVVYRVRSARQDRMSRAELTGTDPP